jgi:hypothetical protein
MKKTHFGRIARGLIGFQLALVPLCVGVISAPALSASEIAQGEELDQIIFRDGRIIKGVIAEETDKSVSMFVVVGTIKGASATVYDKEKILSVIRGTGSDTPQAVATDRKMDEIANNPRETAAQPGRKVIYHIKLDGWFGRDINVTPLKQAIDASKKLNPDYLLIEVDNRWERFGQDLGDDRANFDEFSIADKLEPILRQDLQTHWKNPPEVVVWVKNAMAGAAFIPFFSPNVYFSSEGRMGGIGNLGGMFGSMGDEVVRDKQESLRLGRAKGMAIVNGYDPRIMEAMTMREYVLYYTMDGGRPVYYNEPVPGAELLTDDGKDDNADTMEAQVRSEGNDVLTLRAELAQKLGISKGTADTVEDVLFYLGVLDNYELVEDKPERVLARWSKTIDRLERDIPRMFREYDEIEVGGTYNERKRARGAQINLLKKIITQVERYEESLRFTQINIPPVAQLRTMIEQLRLEQLADRP